MKIDRLEDIFMALIGVLLGSVFIPKGIQVQIIVRLITSLLIVALAAASILLLGTFLPGCASQAELVRVRNCRFLGAGLYDCEAIAPRDWERLR